jgi:hypothetical protein
VGKVEISPRSLRFVAGAPECGAEEKAGHSGLDDGVGKEQIKRGKE